MKHNQYTEEIYEKAISLNKSKKINEIAKELGVPIRTLCNWFIGAHKPKCISKKWNEWNKRRHSNLGKFSQRISIYPNKLKEYEKAYLLGVYIGDGNSSDGFDLQVKDFNFAGYVANLLSKICQRNIKPNKYLRLHKSGRNEIGYRVRIVRKKLKIWLEKNTKLKKSIPNFNSIKAKYYFFGGFFDSEGTIKYGGRILKNKRKTGMYLSICQKDKHILEQLRNTLLQLKIRGTIKQDRNYFLLNIFNKKNHRKIIQNSNIVIQRKRQKILDYIGD